MWSAQTRSINVEKNEGVKENTKTVRPAFEADVHIQSQDKESLGEHVELILICFDLTNPLESC